MPKINTTAVSEKTLEKVKDCIVSNNGVGITDISEETEKSLSCITSAVKILTNRGEISKGVKRNICIRTGEFTGGYGPAYYYD